MMLISLDYEHQTIIPIVLMLNRLVMLSNTAFSKAKQMNSDVNVSPVLRAGRSWYGGFCMHRTPTSLNS